jgi:cell division protein FtsB
LQYRLWFASDGVGDMLRLKRMLILQAEENKKLQQHNDELLFQVQRLQKSPEETESRARNELGMIKKGETFYQIVH